MTGLTELEHTKNLNLGGNKDAEILVVCDAPGQKVFSDGNTMGKVAMGLFFANAQKAGFENDQFGFITPCPPIPEEIDGSKSRENLFMTTYAEEFQQALTQFPNVKMLIYLGPRAGRQVLQRPVKITKVRGQVSTPEGFPYPVLAMLSPANVLRRPELSETFETDFQIASMVAEAGWDTSVLSDSVTQADYKYCFDLTGWLIDPPKGLGLDLESKGGQWWEPTCRVICVQLSREEGKSLVVPLDVEWFNQEVPEGCQPLTYRRRAMLKDQIKELLGNPKVAVTGSNLSGDLHKLRKEGIEIANWAHETQNLVFCKDENTFNKGLDDSTRRWLFEMAGYADEFNRTVDKEHMERVKPADMLPYGGGDPDASRRLTVKLIKDIKGDPRQWNCYQRIQMPAMRTFNRVEEIGLLVDKQALRDLGVLLEEKASALYDELIKQVAPSIKLKHEKKGLSFSRADFIIDILFAHPDGFKLTPVVWTKGTQKLKDASQRVPSTSVKDHLPYFKEIPFVEKLIEQKKLAKMRSTYVGEEGGKLIPQRRKNAPDKYTEHTGFWKYIGPDGRIHPAYFLHRAVTGRTSSAYPNAQNFPKRGDLAEAFRKIFLPTPGYVFVEADLSQAELRIAAWMAQETNMLRIYRSGGDVHEATAAAIMGVDITTFKTWKGNKGELPKQLKNQTVWVETYDKLYKLKRYQAKAVNFGFIFGMGWRKFKTYAKTDYQLDFTDAEAQKFREVFFSLYPKLADWHKSMRKFANQHGYVRALHGAVRHLPNIYSGDDAVKGECERQAINSPVQRFSSDMCLMGLIRFARDCDWEIMRPVMMVHDSIVVEVKIGHEDEAMPAIKWYMESPPLEAWFDLDYRLPVVSDISIARKNLGESEELDIVAKQPDFWQEEYDLAA